MYLKPCRVKSIIYNIIRNRCKMLKITLFLVAFVCTSYVASWRGLILGNGQWLLMNVGLCENPDQYEMKFNITRRKINRTHDCFNIHVDLHREINTTYGIQIDVYQLVDGGFKFFQTLADDCACTYLMKHAEANVKRALRLGNIDPPDCPIQPGKHLINDFVMDYRQLPKQSVYGTFLAVVQFNYEGVSVACIKCVLNFDEHNGQNSDEEDDGMPDLPFRLV